MQNETEVKKFLHSWLGHRKMATPNYKQLGLHIVGEAAVGYKFEVRSASLPNIVGNGWDRSKKHAMTKAAQNYCEKLIELGRMNRADMPFFEAGNDSEIDQQANIPIQRDIEVPTQRQVIDVAERGTADDAGWDLDNCEAGLDEFIRAKSIALSFKFTPIGIKKHSAFIAEITFTLKEAGGSETEIYAREEGKTRQIASAKCTLKVIRQLFQRQLIGPADCSREKMPSETQSPPPVEPVVFKSDSGLLTAVVRPQPPKKARFEPPDEDHDVAEQEAHYDNNPEESDDYGEWDNTDEQETGWDSPRYVMSSPPYHDSIVYLDDDDEM